MKLFLVCDVDNTLAPFKHNLALLRLLNYLTSQSTLSQHAARQMARFVHLCYQNISAKGRGTEYDQGLVQRIEEMALCVENHGDSDIFWSRELWLYAASGEAGRTVSAKLAIDAAEAYWKGIEARPSLYEDVKEFFESQWWYNGLWKLVLATSTDARLYVASDGNRLVYDPEYSDRKKRERIPLSLFDISGNNLFTGDPIGKPDPRFWEQVVTNIGYDPNEDVAVMVGDSPAVDLAGLPHGFVPILLDRDKVRILNEVKEAQIILFGFDALPFRLSGLENQAKERR